MISDFGAPKNECLILSKDQIDEHFLCHLSHKRRNAKMISPFSSAFPKILMASAEHKPKQGAKSLS